MRQTKIVPLNTALLFVLLSLLPAAGATPVEDPAPLPPWGLTVEPSGSGYLLTWQEPPGSVDGYSVYRAAGWTDVMTGGVDAFTLVGGTTDLNFWDDAVASENPVYYVVSTEDGQESAPSAPQDGQYPYCWQINLQCWIP